ncbi:MAG TPA: glycosyltransferase 87 family protein [Actinomycetota bacterium]|nr:glycosyltransferase 87 family protein [Actinomycetota bacterium]
MSSLIGAHTSQPAGPPARLAQVRGRVALTLIAAAVALVVATALLGPSAAVIPLPPGAFPIGGNLHPSAWLVTALLALAVVAGVAGTALAWAAVGGGWAPSPRKLLAGGLVATGLLVVVPPVASADVLSYAAYGHIAARGLDPYTTVPASLPHDPYARAVEAPWQATPSIYGPLATWEEQAMVSLAGGHRRRAVGLLDLANGSAFALAGALLLGVAGADEDRRRKALLALLLNPVVLLLVVAGGHVDALVVLAVAGGLALFRRSPLWAGVIGGAGTLVKLTGALPLVGWAWAARGRRRGGLVAAAAILVAAGYAIVGLHAFNQARRASSLVSVGTPWRPLRSLLQHTVGHPAATATVAVGSAALMVWLAVRLARDLPPAASETTQTTQTTEAARAALVLTLAWTLGAAYVLGWYDAVPWALLALLPVSRYHRILLAHSGILALAYLPGRVVPLPAGLAGITTALRSAASPAVLALLIIVCLVPSRLIPTEDSQLPAAH